MEFDRSVVQILSFHGVHLRLVLVRNDETISQVETILISLGTQSLSVATCRHVEARVIRSTHMTPDTLWEVEVSGVLIEFIREN